MRTPAVAAPGEPHLAAPGSGAPSAARDGLLSGLVVVVVSETGGNLPGLVASLHRAGCAAHVATHVVEARRSLTALGARAVVVVDVLSPPAWLHASLPVLSRQDALVVSTGRATSRERAALLEGGADAVVCAGGAHEVVAALAAVVRRAARAAPEPPADLVCVGDLQVHLSARVAVVDGRAVTLTSLEFDLLAYFARRPGESLSRERLLRDVWGYDVGGRDTVTVHVRRLRTKVEQDPSRPVRLQTVWGYGYRLAGPADPGTSPTRDEAVAAV